MQQDILDKINADFPNVKEVASILVAMESLNRGPIDDRTYRCILHLSGGNMDKLNYYIDLSFTDYRDLFWQAEYEDPEVQKYDFNKTFHSQGLL